MIPGWDGVTEKVNGIEQMAQYSKPEEFVVELDTPKAGTFLRLVSELDLLMGLTAYIDEQFSSAESDINSARDQISKILEDN